MKILVTGATGFIGRRACELLQTKGLQVTATGRDKAKAQYLAKLGIEFIPVELSSAKEVSSLSGHYDALVHCGGLSSPWGKADEFSQANVVGTENVVNFCHENKVGKLIFISSSSVYFTGKDRFKIKEDDSLAHRPPSKYTASKMAAEQVVQKSRLNSLILRPRGIFGPGDQAIVPRLLKAQRLGRLPIIGNGKNIVDITYVDNLIEAIYLGLKCGQEYSGEIFNITNDEPIKIWGFFEELFRLMGLTAPQRKIPFSLIYVYALISECVSRFITAKEPLLTVYTASLLARSQTLDISKAKDLLGYKPIYSLQQGLEKTVAALKENK